MRVCDPMLPGLAEEFGVDTAHAAHVITYFAIAYGIFQIVHGPIGDRLGKYRVISTATLLAALGSFTCAIAPSLNALVAARFMTGAIAAAVIPLSFAWLGDVIDYEQRQPALARFMSGSILGVIVGQLVGGIFVDTLGWRAAFCALGLMFALAGTLLIRQSRRMPQGKTSATLVKNPLKLLANYASIARDPWVRKLLGIILVEGMLIFGSVAFIPTALHQRFSIPLWMAGLIGSMFGVGGLCYTTFARRLLLRFGERGLVLIGGSLVAAGLLTIDFAPSWQVAVAGCLMMGMGFYGFHNTLQTHGTQISPSQRGMGMSLFAFTFFAGQSGGVALASATIARSGFTVVFAGAAVALLAMTAVFGIALARRSANRLSS